MAALQRGGQLLVDNTQRVWLLGALILRPGMHVVTYGMASLKQACEG